MSEHPSATEAELAAAAKLRAGDQLVVYDRYHRCHAVRRAGHPRGQRNQTLGPA